MRQTKAALESPRPVLCVPLTAGTIVAMSSFSFAVGHDWFSSFKLDLLGLQGRIARSNRISNVRLPGARQKLSRFLVQSANLTAMHAAVRERRARHMEHTGILVRPVRS